MTLVARNSAGIVIIVTLALKATLRLAFHASVEIMTILALFLAASGILRNDRM